MKSGSSSSGSVLQKALKPLDQHDSQGTSILSKKSFTRFAAILPPYMPPIFTIV